MPESQTPNMLSAAAAPARLDEGPIGRRRYVIAVMLMLLITVGYVDRMVLSMAGPSLAKDFNLTPFALGLLYSAFLWGYAASMIPIGWTVDRVGKHIVLPVAVVFWTLVSMATGLMTGLVGLFVVRILLGVGESPSFSCSNLVIREWAPLKERGGFTAAMQTGTLLGPGVATAPAALVVAHYGWRPSFIILSSVGFVWLAGWLLLYRTPQKARWISDKERQYILSSRTEAPKQTHSPRKECVRMSVGTLLRHRSMIGILLTNGPQTYALYFLLTWLPGYLITARRFNPLKSGVLTSSMFLVAMVGVLLLGRLSDRFLSLTGQDAARGKRRFVVAGLMCCAVLSLAITPWVQNQSVLIVVIGVILMMVTAAITLTWALVSDLIVDESSAGRSFALLSFGGQIMGLMAPIVTGWIVGKAGFTPVFFVTAGLVLCGTVAALTLPKRQLQPLTRGSAS